MYLEKDELITLLGYAEEHGIDLDYTVFLTLAYTGLRVGELVGLKWTNIDFTSRTLKVTKTYYNSNNRITEYDLLTPKNHQRRTIEIDEQVCDQLKRLKKAQNELINIAGSSYYNKGFR